MATNRTVGVSGMWISEEVGPEKFRRTEEWSMKSTAVAYLLWLTLGVVAGHRFYLGRTDSATTLAGFNLWCLFSPLLFPALPSLAVAVVGVLVADALVIPSLVRLANLESGSSSPCGT